MHVIPFTGPTILQGSGEGFPVESPPHQPETPNFLQKPKPTSLELQAEFVRAAAVWLAARDHKGLSDLSY